MSATAVAFISAASSNAATSGSNKAEFACQQALNIGSKGALRAFLRIYRNSNTACNALASTASAGDTPTDNPGNTSKIAIPHGPGGLASNGDGGGGHGNGGHGDGGHGDGGHGDGGHGDGGHGDGGHGDGGHGDGGHGDGGHGDGGHGDGGHGDGGHGDGGHGDGGHGDGGHGDGGHGDYKNLTMN